MASRTVKSSSKKSLASGNWCASPVAAFAHQRAREGGVRIRQWRYRATGNGTTSRTLILCTSTGVMASTTLWHLDGGPHTAVYITTARRPSTGAVACLAGHRVRLHHDAPSGQWSHSSRLWVVRTDGRRVTSPVSAASGPADTPSAVGGHTTVGHTTVDHPCDRRRALARHGGPSLTPPHASESSLGGQPGKQRRVFDAGLGPQRCRCASAFPPARAPQSVASGRSHQTR